MLPFEVAFGHGVCHGNGKQTRTVTAAHARAFSLFLSLWMTLVRIGCAYLTVTNTSRSNSAATWVTLTNSTQDGPVMSCEQLNSPQGENRGRQNPPEILLVREQSVGKQDRLLSWK